MFDLSLCLVLTSAFFSAPIKATSNCDESTFLALHGNDSETSGVWQEVRDISSDEAKLRTLCQRAHHQTGSPSTDEIDTVRFDPKMAIFTKYDDLWENRPIYVDIVSYNVSRPPPSGLRSYQFFYFTRGMKEGCIFYLIKWRRQKPLFRVGYHFCDVEVPV